MTAVRQAEAQSAGLVFHAAMVELGANASSEAFELWQEVAASPTQLAATSGSWITRALRAVMFRRDNGRDLAIAYYRLVRALYTGSTIPDLGPEDDTPTTLGELRQDFADQVRLIAPDAEEKAGVHLRTEGPDSGLRIKVQPLKEPIDSIEGRSRDHAEREAEDVLQILGPQKLRKKLKLIDHGDPAEIVDKEREKAHREAGARQANAAGRMAMNGSRGTLLDLADADPKAIGYARVSKTGKPCGWCAMLISRGAVYKSAESAGDAEGVDQFHDNDQCYAEPVFSLEQFDSDPKFDLNRELSDEWPRVTKGLSGKAAVSEWRKYIRDKWDDQESPTPDS